MREVICVPRRGKQPDYDRAWDLIRRYYDESGFEVFVSDSPTERFNLPGARNAAAALAGDWDVAAFINADCVIPAESIRRGFAHAAATKRLTVPWDHYYSMTLAGHESEADLQVPIGSPHLERWWQDLSEPYVQPFYAPGGDMVIPREVFEHVGGWDERGDGYEPEDAYMLIAAGQFDRLSGPAYHFWHSVGAITWPANQGMWPEYRRRWRDLQASGTFIQHLVDEGRDITDFGGWNWGD